MKGKINKPIIILVTSIFLVVLFVVLFNFKSSVSNTIKNTNTISDNAVKNNSLTADYKANVNKTLTDFNSILNTENFKSENIDEVIFALLQVKVPKELKDTHIEIILSLEKIKAEPELLVKVELSRQMINKLSQKNNWLKISKI